MAPGVHGESAWQPRDAAEREPVRFSLDDSRTQICVVHLPGPWRRGLRQLSPVKRGKHVPSRSLTALYGKCGRSKPRLADSVSLFPPPPLVRTTVTGRNLSEPESTLAITPSFPTVCTQGAKDRRDRWLPGPHTWRGAASGPERGSDRVL